MISWTLDELRLRARRDLTDPKPGCLLDWAFLQAEASGALAGAREWLAFNEHRYRDLKGVLTGRWAPEDDVRLKDMHRQLAELEQAMSTARGEVAYAQTALVATEQVMQLLQRRQVKAAEAAGRKAA
jgi:hypothetical protein